jgi:hypothetical protein
MTVTDDDPAVLRECLTDLLAELARRDVQRARWFTWWCRGWKAGYAAGRQRERQWP